MLYNLDLDTLDLGFSDLKNLENSEWISFKFAITVKWCEDVNWFPKWESLQFQMTTDFSKNIVNANENAKSKNKIKLNN
jgi:hypothetical protein